MLPRFQTIARDRGCQVSALYPTDVKHWLPILEDILGSPPVTALRTKAMSELIQHTEFTYLSIDTTLQGTLSLMGQNPRFKNKRRATRGQAPFDEVGGLREIVSVLGRTSALCHLEAIPTAAGSVVASSIEKALHHDARSQTHVLGVDNPSVSFLEEMKKIFPSLQYMCLDTCHLAMTWEYAHSHKRSAGSIALREVLSKFNVKDSQASLQTWGDCYTGCDISLAIHY